VWKSCASIHNNRGDFSRNTTDAWQKRGRKEEASPLERPARQEVLSSFRGTFKVAPSEKVAVVVADLSDGVLEKWKWYKSILVCSVT